MISMGIFLLLTAVLYSLKFTYAETFTTDHDGCHVIGTYTVEKCGSQVKINGAVIPRSETVSRSYTPSAPPSAPSTFPSASHSPSVGPVTFPTLRS